MAEESSSNIKSAWENLETWNFRNRKEEFGRFIKTTMNIPPEETELLAQTVLEDYQVIRTKYNLPPREMRTENPREYLHKLEGLAKKHKITTRKTYEFEKLFEEDPSASAFYDESTNEIVVPEFDEYSEAGFVGSIRDFEHELIHGLQQERYPDMPIERMEYEAYVACIKNPQVLADNPEKVYIIFDMGMGKSVKAWYAQIDKKPMWEEESIAVETP